MKLVLDEKIPMLKEYFSDHTEVITLPGQHITRHELQTADVLCVRTVTPVNQALLDNTPVRFVASATAGIDHLDTDWLDAHPITWVHAPGCNADAVAEYVVYCMAALQTIGHLQGNHLRAGVIGCGATGSRVAKNLSRLGFDVIANDPPRALKDDTFCSTPLTEFFDLDLICVHTPHTTTGEHPTHHLLDADFLTRLKPGCVLLNAGRGACINTKALLKQPDIVLCLDVFEDEPHIHPALLERCAIATPHIAGYSFAAKMRATDMIADPLSAWLNTPFKKNDQHLKPITVDVNQPGWASTLLTFYNPLTDTKQLKDEHGQHFTTQRRNTVLRQSLTLSDSQ